MELLIAEKNGWSKPVKIDRAITRVGSAPSNDIQLQSSEIAATQIQILYSSGLESSCKVINLADQITVRISHELRQLSTYAAVDVRDGDQILFGDYSITFRLPLSADVMQSATMIHAILSFTDAILRPGFVTTGLLTIKNTGERSAQFLVELNGLPADCLQVDPIPLMYPGAQEEVRIRVFHRGLYPLAGLQMMVVKVSATESYPGEELIIRQGIYVTPIFKQVLELVDDLSAAQKLQQQITPHEESAIPSQIISSDTEVAPVVFETFTASPSMQQESPDRSAQKQNIPSVSRPVPDISKLKVVRGPADADNFWDDR